MLRSTVPGDDSEKHLCAELQHRFPFEHGLHKTTGVWIGQVRFRFFPMGAGLKNGSTGTSQT